MKRGEIRITYGELTLGIICVILLGLLITVFVVKDCDCEVEEIVAAPTSATTQEPEPLVEEKEPEPVVATCSDGEKNQDESDVDCGGVCGPCANGESCRSDDDCASDDCVDRVCVAPRSLSGEVSFGFSAVNHEEATSGSAFVESVTVSVENGLDDIQNLELEIYTKSSNDIYFLNQLADDELDENYKPYAIVPLPALAPGESYAETVSLDGYYSSSKYVYSTTGRYDPGDEFRVEVRLVEANTGDLITSAQQRVRI